MRCNYNASMHNWVEVRLREAFHKEKSQNCGRFPCGGGGHIVDLELSRPNFNQISEFPPNFTFLAKFQIFGQISEFQPNFRTWTKFWNLAKFWNLFQLTLSFNKAPSPVRPTSSLQPPAPLPPSCDHTNSS